MAIDSIENYCWGKYNFSNRDIYVLDTSLRDGEQSGVIKLPSLEEELMFVDKLAEIGIIDAIDLTTPVTRGPKLQKAIALAKRISPSIDVVCLARTHQRDIKAALELQQKSGRQIKGIIFVGSSNLRLDVEQWNTNEITRWMAENVATASREGMIPIVATEHTTETSPAVIEKIFRAGLDNGGKEVCIADTTGVATPEGTRVLVRFMRETVLKGLSGVKIHWHGHDDYGFSVANSLAALDEGADIAHVTTLGIGERSGNCPLEPLMINLKRFGDPKRQDLTQLYEFAKFSSKIFKDPLRTNYPGIGENNRKYASGIHGSAYQKARKEGKPNPYESVPQSWFGLKVEAIVGPVAGEDNAEAVLEDLGITPTPRLVEALLETAIRINDSLTKAQVLEIITNINDNNGNNHGNS